MNKACIRGYYGLGDNIYERPFVIEATRLYDEVYFYTPFPELYHNHPRIRFCKPITKLKTQAKNISKYSDDFWAEPKAIKKNLKFDYHRDRMEKGWSIIESFTHVVPIEKLDFNMPLDPSWINSAKKIISPIRTRKKMCLLSQPSIRSEWVNYARNPKAEYFQLLIDRHIDEYFFVSVGDNKEGIEWHAEEDLKDIDMRFDHGELDIFTIFGLAAMADIVLCYPSFLLPLCLAVKAKCFCIYGGSVRNDILVDPRMDLSNYSYVEPSPFCNCLIERHDCNKYIDEDVIIDRFEELKARPISGAIKVVYKQLSAPEVMIKQNKHNILICRLRADRCHKIANNPLVAENLNVVTIDHTPLDTYQKYHSSFKNFYKWKLLSESDAALYDQASGVIKENKISIAIIAQKLFRYSNIMEQACRAAGVKVIWTEAFFDEKLIYDYTGLQYDCPNDIYKYVNKVHMNGSEIDFPKSTRENQPASLTRDEVFEKYNLNDTKKYIVVLGQLLWDMSILKSVNKRVQSYDDYIDLIIGNNPDTIFLLKHHPYYIYHCPKIDTAKYIEKYDNIVEINESLDTLFNSFDCFTTFSSTTVLEGVIKYKKFATVGHHYCNSDDLVIQLRTNDKARDLYNKIKDFRIKEATRKKYLNFICNYYAVAYDSDKLYHKIVKEPHDYYLTKY